MFGLLVITNITVRFMAHDKTQTTEAVRDNPVVSSTTAHLINCIHFFESMPKAPKVSCVTASSRQNIAVFPTISTLVANGSSQPFGNLGLTNERSLRMLFLSVTMSTERMSNDGFVVYNARNSGSSGLSGWRAAFVQCR